MRRIVLHTTDVELFDTDIQPTTADFFHRHKDAFRQMKIEQGKDFWKRFVISFRAFSTQHGTIKDAPLPSEKMDGLYDEVFILILEEFVEAKPNTAKSFIYDIVLLAKNQQNFPNLDGKLPKSRDLFYIKESREVFRRFFGPPSSKVSYIKVYVLSPILIKFGGAVCVCLKRWLNAIEMDPSDTSYWRPPSAASVTRRHFKPVNRMCTSCFSTVARACFRERVNGDPKGPQWLVEWTYGDPRHNDPLNPLYDPSADPASDWRDKLKFAKFSAFFQYVQITYTHHVMDAVGLMVDCDCDTYIKGYGMPVGQDYSHVFIIEATEKKPTANKVFGIKKKKKNKKTATPQKAKGSADRSSAAHTANGKPKVIQLQEVESDSTSESDGSCEWDSEDELFQHLPWGRYDEMAGLCKVMTIVDSKTGGQEVIITTAAEAPELVDPTDMYSFERTEWPLNERFLRYKFDNRLPERFKWYEGLGMVGALFDYTVEESGQTDKPTNFCLWMMSREEMRLKWLMTHMIGYVMKRKKRKSPGWTLTSEDVVVNMLPHLRAALWEGLCIRIQNGVNTRDLLPDETGHRPYVCTKRLNTRLFCVNPVEASTWTKNPDGSLQLDEASNATIELSRLESLVTSMKKELKATYGRRKILVCKDFYSHTARILPERLDSVRLSDVYQRAVVEDYAEICSATIGRIAIALLEEPGRSLADLCHNLSLQVAYQIEQFVMERKKCQKDTVGANGNDGVYKSIREPLHNYCKGMVTRLQFTEDLDSDEEDAATEAVIDTLFKNVPKSAKPSDSQCPKCHRLKTPVVPPVHSACETPNCKVRKAKPSCTATSSSDQDARDLTAQSKGCQTNVERVHATVKITEEFNSLSVGESKSGKKSPSANNQTPKSKEKVSNLAKKNTAQTVTKNGTGSQMDFEKARSRPSGNWHDNVKSVSDIAHLKNLKPKVTSVDSTKADPKEFSKSVDSDICNVLNPSDEQAEKQTKDSSTEETGSTLPSATVDVNKTKNKQKRNKKSKNSSPEHGGEKMLAKAAAEEKLTERDDVEPVKTSNMTNHDEIPEQKPVSVKDDNSDSSKGRNSDASKGDNQEQAADNKEDNSKRLKTCANCGTQEPKPKTYKKCQKCRTQDVEKPRYYCGRDCQVSDWGKRHREEHRTNVFA